MATSYCASTLFGVAVTVARGLLLGSRAGRVPRFEEVMGMKSLSVAVAGMTALTVGACSASPGSSEATRSQSQALCGNGIYPGCGDCYPDPESPLGGYRDCWTCAGDTYTLECVAYPTITATWSGHLFTWNDRFGPEQGDFSIPIKFEEVRGAWGIGISSLSISIGATLSLQDGQEGSGHVDGDSATLALPVTVSAWGQSVNIGLNVATGQTIYPPGIEPQSAGVYPEPGLLQMVGQGAGDDGHTYWAFFNGTISAWPQ